MLQNERKRKCPDCKHLIEIMDNTNMFDDGNTPDDTVLCTARAVLKAFKINPMPAKSETAAAELRVRTGLGARADSAALVEANRANAGD